MHRDAIGEFTGRGFSLFTLSVVGASQASQLTCEHAYSDDVAYYSPCPCLEDKQLASAPLIMDDNSTPPNTHENRPSTPVMIRLNDDLRELRIASEPRIAKRSKGSYIVVSGGTAANDFVQAFGKDCAFVLPGTFLFPPHGNKPSA